MKTQLKRQGTIVVMLAVVALLLTEGAVWAGLYGTRWPRNDPDATRDGACVTYSFMADGTVIANPPDTSNTGVGTSDFDANVSGDGGVGGQAAARAAIRRALATWEGAADIHFLETADNGERLWLDRDLPYTSRAHTAQRLAKIALEQHRQGNQHRIGHPKQHHRRESGHQWGREVRQWIHPESHQQRHNDLQTFRQPVGDPARNHPTRAKPLYFRFFLIRLVHRAFGLIRPIFCGEFTTLPIPVCAGPVSLVFVCSIPCLSIPLFLHRLQPVCGWKILEKTIQFRILSIFPILGCTTNVVFFGRDFPCGDNSFRKFDKQ